MVVTMENASEKLAKKRVWCTSTDALKEGYPVCYNRESTTGNSAGGADMARAWEVQQPATANLNYFAGFVAMNYKANANGQMIEIIEPRKAGSIATAYIGISATLGTTELAIQNAKWTLEAAGTGTYVVATANQTIDRSSTEGICQVILKGLADPALSEVTAALSRTTVQLPTAAIWGNFDLQSLRANPFGGSWLDTDFRDARSTPIVTFADTTGLMINSVEASIGILNFFSSADNDAVEAQFQCPIDVDAGGVWGFEVRLKIANITTDVAAFAIGLASSQALVGDIIADNGATVTTGTNYIYFQYDAAATAALDLTYLLSGQSHVEHDAAIKTMVANTYFTVGMYYDGTDIQTFVDGVNVADPILGTGDMDDGNFPTGTILVPTIAVKGLNAADWDMDIDWMRCAQE